MGFLSAISNAESYGHTRPLIPLPDFMLTSGRLPEPFDALNGPHLAGPQGSHPLALVEASRLLTGPEGGLEGAIEIEGPVRVGEGVSGRLRARATRDIRARAAAFRLVGMRIFEEQRSRTQRDASGNETTEWWVEVTGDRFEDLPFSEPHLPTSITAGQEIDLAFILPAPRLGPPSAHAGSAMVAWAMEARWDIEMGRDARIAALLDVRHHHDMLRAGVLRVGAGAMADVWVDDPASLSVEPHPPLAPGADVELSIAWPGAPSGRAVRVEHTVDVEAPQRLSVVAVSMSIDPAGLAGTKVSIPIPADAPPTLETDGLKVSHRLRVIVDRPMRPDVSVERLVVVG